MAALKYKISDMIIQKPRQLLGLCIAWFVVLHVNFLFNMVEENIREILHQTLYKYWNDPYWWYYIDNGIFNNIERMFESELWRYYLAIFTLGIILHNLKPFEKQDYYRNIAFRVQRLLLNIWLFGIVFYAVFAFYIVAASALWPDWIWFKPKLTLPLFDIFIYLGGQVVTVIIGYIIFYKFRAMTTIEFLDHHFKFYFMEFTTVSIDNSVE